MKQEIKFNHIFKNGIKKDNVSNIEIPLTEKTLFIYKTVLKKGNKNADRV